MDRMPETRLTPPLPSPGPSASRGSTARVVILGAILGLAYGLMIRFVVANEADFTGFYDPIMFMTLSFIFGVPVVMGWFSVRRHPDPSLRVRILLPWLPVVACLLVTLAVGWEGAICLLMAAPIMLAGGSVGGIIGGRRSLGGRRATGTLVLLPLVAMPLESRFSPSDETRVVVVVRDVDAPPSVAWRHVVQVPAIEPHERRPALFTALGFPPAMSAILDREEVGGIRHARFEGGVLFIETVTAFEKERRLAFTLDARADLIPPTTLDSHVTIGGPFFDTLDGSYELEPLPGGRTRVVLTSRHRLSTRFNAYSGIWSDAIMRSIQANILEVVAMRCERRGL